ncbi:YwmB family TATA-box binding protein [Fictibacillus phosphorivorans]|uniref:YwmB family TATA-box binding protein n=1 Tax=Fictibacillus phosphorivorans TaxID=1221500 RepID=UPI00203A7648|nr:YwmB family TATA-box binding protein [Fictibacillus phosphorivorans]MCM3718353.1 YwmB family TATA-box binding protein [Fictibacillus phosphorivorans]MCM3775977.1 YwmB family TATA-box binding protein [Fictibacillus phosphorivorans]
MKKWTMTITAILLIMMVSNGYAKDVQTNEVAHIIDVLKEKGVKPDKWTIYFNGELGFISKGLGYKQAEELKRDYPEFRWAASEDESGHYKMIGKFHHKELGLTEKVTIITYPQKEQLSSYFIYAVEGPVNTNQNWKEIQRLLDSRIRESVGGNPKIFSCVTGTYGDKMVVDLYSQANELVQAFSGVPVEELKEETFVSLSAYTEQWEQAIYTGHQNKMNLQVALRSEGLGSKTTVTIGTPIITSEY